MNTLRISRAAPPHVAQLVPLFLDYLDFYRQPAPAKRVRAFLLARLRRNESVIFLARLDNQPVGFAQLYPTFASLALKRAWILSDLFVVPIARRHGVATALLNRAHRLGATTGAAELVLETARTNRQAQCLYEGLGWQRDTAFLMYRRTYQRRE